MNLPPPRNPFARRTFWGREKELSIISSRLLNNPPQSFVIIGEPYMGKTRIVRYLMQMPLIDEQGKGRTMPYLDCALYSRFAEDWPLTGQADTEQKRERNMGNFASARFWWDLYNAMPKDLQDKKTFDEPRRTEDELSLLDTAYDISDTIKTRVRDHYQPVVFILDNFEGVARLPLHNSDWLRSMKDNCAFILTSRYALYILYNYHPTSWEEPSPFYNIFSGSIYLGLLAEQEVKAHLEEAEQLAKKAGSNWHSQDRTFIRKVAGRHPELLRIACARLFEERLLTPPEKLNDEPDNTFLELLIIQDANLLCKQLWLGLANYELYDVPEPLRSSKEEHSQILSSYQHTMIDIAHGRSSSEKKMLFELEQRGLIEWAEDAWRVFARAMQEFVLAQEQAITRASAEMQAGTGSPALPPSAERDDDKPLTYMEGKVYDYLKTRLGEVCDRSEIMQAVWAEDTMPSNSALQKIIERIRDKIDNDPDNPYKLIAVRGRGYMLRRAM